MQRDLSPVVIAPETVQGWNTDDITHSAWHGEELRKKIPPQFDIALFFFFFS